MPVKAGCYVSRMFLNDDASTWHVYLDVSVASVNGEPRHDSSELDLGVALNENQAQQAVIDHTKAFTTQRWGLTWGPSDTVQMWLSTRVEG